jgi:Zn-dependent alcohol dehydrogenase
LVSVGRLLDVSSEFHPDEKDAGNKKDVSTECGAEHFVDFQSEKDVAGKINELTGGGCHVA